jgi:RimJ/RimL family protein N-acetyltransferase
VPGSRIQIEPIADSHADSFRLCLDVVARERRYIALLEAPPLDAVREFVHANIEADAIQFVALDGSRVVGWADVFSPWQPALAHTGTLGIGVLPEYRGQGIGTRLLSEVFRKARTKSVTRIELEARSDNHGAIRVYERAGFRREGTKRNAMRFDGQYHDTVLMAALLGLDA